MSGIEPVLRTDQLTKLARKFDGILTGPSPRAIREIGSDLVRSTRRRIASEKASPDGTPWYAWSDAYERTKRPGTMLRQSGALMRSINHVPGPDTLEVGSNDIKAAVHQYGHTVRSGAFAGARIPARPYLGLSDSDSAAINDRMIADIRRRIGAAA